MGETYADIARASYDDGLEAAKELDAAIDAFLAGPIDVELLAALHEADVTRGHHAVECLLWGRDPNGTVAGGGERPWTDFAGGAACTHGHCDRRRAYLEAASGLLVADLEEIVASRGADGAARADFGADGPAAGVARILEGLGSLSYGELAGERMKLGLVLHDPEEAGEEEHEGFADDTHNPHVDNVVGMRNVDLGRYEGRDGTVVGPAVTDLVRAADPALDAEMRARLEPTHAAFLDIEQAAESGAMAHDQRLAAGDAEGHALLQAGIDAPVAQTETLERIIAELALGQVAFMGSDGLDRPGAVFQ